MVADREEETVVVRLIAQGNPIGSCPVHLTTTIHQMFEGCQCIVVVR